jgi:hypothetical protein
MFENLENKPPRKDNYGTLIEKGKGKKHRVIFADNQIVQNREK